MRQLPILEIYFPSQKAIELKQEFDKNGINLIVVSNNHSKRVKAYASSLGVDHIFSARKPSSKIIDKYVIEMKINKADAIIIGDQTITDIWCANNAKIRSVLTDKLVAVDQPITRFNRVFDRIIRRKLIKKKLLVDWRNRL
mgnify:CR=1 FL=1